MKGSGAKGLNTRKATMRLEAFVIEGSGSVGIAASSDARLWISDGHLARNRIGLRKRGGAVEARDVDLSGQFPRLVEGDFDPEILRKVAFDPRGSVPWSSGARSGADWASLCPARSEAGR